MRHLLVYANTHITSILPQIEPLLVDVVHKVFADEFVKPTMPFRYC